MRIVVFLILMVCAFPAFAQDSVIRVVKPDGSVQELDISKPAPEASEPAPPKKIETLPVVKKQAPVAETKPADVKPVETKSKPSPVKKNVAVKRGAVPKPGRKPPVPGRLQIPGAPFSAAPSLERAGGEITEKQAVQIALTHAPPSSGFEVTRSTYQGREVYAVMFKTDSGREDVLIDAVSGAYVASVHYNNDAPRKPGVLPVR